MDNDVTVWFISKYAVSPKQGNATRQYFLSKFFARKGYNTILISSQSANIKNHEQLDAFFKLEIEESLKHYILKGPKINLGFSMLRIWSWILFEVNLFKLTLITKRLNKPQVIIVSSLSILSFCSGVLLSWKYRAKLILEVRDIWPLSLIEVGGFSKYNPFVIMLRLIEKFGYNHADAIVGTMPNLKQHVENSIKRKVPVYYVPQGYDHTLSGIAKLSEASERKLVDVSGSTFNVIYSGSIGNSNNVGLILEVAKELDTSQSRIKFYILGEGSRKEGFLKEYAELTNVNFISQIAYNEVPLFLSNFDLLIYPVEDHSIYRFGISPNKMIDYMRSGRPILVSYSGYPSLIDGERYSFSVPANDKNAIVAKLKEISKMEKITLNEMGARAIQIVSENQSFDSLSDIYINLF